MPIRIITGIPSLLLLFSLNISFSQTSEEAQQFSLREAQIYALENNYDVINAVTDIEIARKRVKENLALGFPQINASAGYSNFIEIPTQLIPSEFFPGAPAGEFVEIQFGTKHNATWNASLDQLIFSGQYIVGIQASRAYVGLTESTLEKSQIEIKDLIAKSYYPVIILKQNKLVFDSTLATMEDMLYETEEYYKAGLVEDTDVDQLKLLIADIETTITNLDNQLEIANNTLKYMMGLPADQEIDVTDKVEDLLVEVDRDMLLNTPFDYNQHIDYKLMMDQERLALMQLKLNRAEYYPTLSGYYTYQQDAFRQDVQFFSEGARWYPNQVLGFSLNVPIFSSGHRQAKVQQAKLELEKIDVQQNQLRQGLSLQVKTVKSEFNNAYLIYQTKKLALGNAEKIYQKTQVKYRSGLSTSLELSQTYNQYLTTQIDYLTAILDLFNKQSDLEKELTRVSMDEE